MKTVLIKSLFLSGVIALAIAPSAHALSASNQAAVNKGIAYLQTQQSADGHINGFDGITPWAAIAFSSAGISLDTVKTAGGASLRSYLASNPPGATAKATEWEKDILAITADNQNPYNFGGVNYVAGLRALATGGQIGNLSTVNDDVFGVLALAASRADVTDPVFTGALNFVLAHQHADGGFSSGADAAATSDVDDTAAAVMALEAARNAGIGGSAAGPAITNALAFIAAMKNSDGGYPFDKNFGAASDVSSTSWVVMALGAAGQAASLTLRALRLESTVDKVTAHNASILENLGGGFVAIDTHGRLMLCNPSAKKLLGLPDDLALGQPIDQSLAALPEMGEILLDTLVKKETVKRQDLWWKLKGESRVLGYSTLLIQDPQGQVVGAGITFQDITQFQKK